MNLNINPQLTTSIAADRRRAFALEAQVNRTRKIGRLARRAARLAFQAVAAGHAAPSPIAPVTSIVRSTRTAPIVGPVDSPIDASIADATVLASSDLEHASARVA